MEKKRDKKLLKNGLKILNFNVEGLSSTLIDPNFIRCIYKFDICILTETWKKDESKLNIPGYWDFSQVRPKYLKKGRHSGGITVLCKENYRAGLKILHSKESFIWMKLDKNFFSLDNDIYLCAIYITPLYSKNVSAKSADHFTLLSDSILKYSALGNIILAGDFNARTGAKFAIPYKHVSEVEELCPDEGKGDLGMSRISQDKTVNLFGKKLMRLCQNFKMKIANGAVPGDRIGAFTCHNHRGSSVVDYFILDHSIFNLVSNLIVLPPVFDSVHSPVSIFIETNIKIHKSIESLDPLPRKFKWDSLKCETFLKLINQEENIKQIKSIEATLLQAKNVDILDECTSKLTNFLVDTASKVFKLHTQSKKVKTNKKSAVWFTNDCHRAKSRLKNLAKLLQKSPKDPFIRGSFISFKKKYKNMLKVKKEEFVKHKLSKLNQLLKNPKQFWSYLKNIRRVGQGYGNYITVEKWVEHFEHLSGKDPSLVNNNLKHCETINSLLDDFLKKESTCEFLDSSFTLSVVKGAIDKLKLGKANGTDSISNELLKGSRDVIGPAIGLLFSKMIELSHFPNNWSMSLIVPIHKGGELNDPNNF